MRRCSCCRRERPEEAFKKDRGGGSVKVMATCQSCRNSTSRQVYHRSVAADKVAKKNCARRARLDRQYQERLAGQSGVCAICGQEPTLKEVKLVRDHCHETGQQRELLCVSCNYGLGCFKDDPVRIASAVAYLVRHKMLGV